MQYYTVILIIMSLMLGASAFAEKLKIPSTIFLIVVGMVLGFIPAMPLMDLNPEVVMLLFLPPLLYDAAFNISFKDFRTHISTISTLAIGLVFITTAGIAIVAYCLIPSLTWPVAFVLGATLSATDAVAAIGITKGLGLSHRTVSILEGESLVNDASALVAYRFAVAAVTGVAFVWWDALLDFVLVLTGGFLIGWIISKLLEKVLYYFRDNDMLVISLTLLMPFVTYLVAEHFDVSGVIAVVVLGLQMSRLSKSNFPEALKQRSRHFWDVIIFLLNGLIFVLIGLEFPWILRKIHETHIWHYIGIAAIITVATFIIRWAHVYLQQRSLRKSYMGKYRWRRVSKDALLDSQTSLIIAWAGMRGIVSLAIALGLPLYLDNDAPFPMRNEIIFIAISVVLLSLLGQGITLPWVVKKAREWNKPTVVSEERYELE